ncbi:glycosyltransferase family 2 protein [Candidatus Woesebacteria bacterium]|nr:glycosyltransferase family 2 protein [Candidatus Woesebacteria bacterium]
MIKFLDRHEKFVTRALEIFPGLLAWGIIFLPAIGGLFMPNIVAYALLVFIVYWFFKSFKAAFFSIIGYFMVKEWSKIDWKKRWEENKNQSKFKNWKDIKHVVIIPTYNESVKILKKPLDSLKNQKQIDTKNLYVIVTLEKRAEGSKERAKELESIYGKSFGYFFTTLHPDGLPGEIRGIASNQTWGAKQIKKHLDKLNIDLGNFTVTKGDADTVFHPNYFAALGFQFAMDKKRYIKIWQSPLFWYNNFHKIPFPIKMLGVIGHAIQISELLEPSRLVFNQSVYSMSFELLYETGYWHTDIIPEDWHFFLQAFFHTKGEVQVDPIYIPTHIDAPESKSWLGTMKNRYKQCKRHAWGASDIPYAIKESIRHPEIPPLKRVMRVYKLIETHVVWSTNWFLLTLGATLPAVINPEFSRTSLGYNLPKMAESILTICLIALVVMVIIDLKLRPKKAKPDTIFKAIKEVLQWVTFPLITLPMSVLPGLHAQTMLMFGKRLEYKTTDKV